MPGRFDKDFYSAELLSDILSRGHSSRLYNKLVKEKEVFTSISSFTMGTLDPGMMIISGRVKEGINLEEAEEQVSEVLNTLLEKGLAEDELQKVKNQAQTMQEFEKVEVINRAMNLAFAALSGNADLVNQEADLIESVTSEEAIEIGKKIFDENNSNVLYYNSKSA
jgi:zinc protease